jgi:polyhydroxyalkanoate synthase
MDSLHEWIEKFIVGFTKWGKISQTDSNAFEIGKNMTTEGSIIYQNALFQLIQYKPQTSTVMKNHS